MFQDIQVPTFLKLVKYFMHKFANKFLFLIFILPSILWGQNKLIFDEVLEFKIDTKQLTLKPPVDKVWILEDFKNNDSNLAADSLIVFVDDNKFNLKQLKKNTIIARKSIIFKTFPGLSGILKVGQYSIVPIETTLIDAK